MRHHIVLPLVCAAMVFGLLSCSQGFQSPTVPGSDPSFRPTDSGDNTSCSAKSLWGFWDVSIDPSSGAVDVVPLRGVEFKANVTMFLQPPAGKLTNLKINIVDMSNFPTEGLIDVDVTLVHPFPGLDVYTGFDVLGVFVHDGDAYSSYDPSIFYARASEVAKLLNPDGYTRWFNPQEFTQSGILGFTEGKLGNKGMTFTATLNPYRYFCDGLGSDDDLTEFFHEATNVEQRGLFSSTGSNTRLYRLQFPMLGPVPILTFQYAVIASWEPPVIDPPVNIPDDFPISANAKEAFQLSIADNGSTLFYDNGIGGGTVKIRAEMFDWGAQQNSLGILGEFSKIVVESPNSNVLGDYLEFLPDDFEPYTQPGTAVSSIAELEFTGVEPTSKDDVEFLVTVVGKEGDTYNQGFPVPAPDVPLSGYWRFTIPVGSNPCANFEVTGADPSPAESGQAYTGFIVSGTNFQNGTNLAVDIVDGTDVLASATNVLWVDPSTITCDFDFCGVNPGDFDLRVTNGCDPISYASIAYTIAPDPLKNIYLRSVQISDLGVRQDTGEPYVQFADNQTWIYDEDYSNGQYMNMYGAANLDRIDVLNCGEASMGSTTSYGQYIYVRDTNSYWLAGYSGNMLDVMVIYDNTRHYYVQNAGSSILHTRRTCPAHGGNLASYTNVGAGPGLINMAAVKGIDTSSDLPENITAWFYILEGAPDFSVERINYDDVGSGHVWHQNQTFLSGPGNGSNQVNDPKDISVDIDDYVYILDKLSTGQPVVKIYDSNMNYIGEVGDSVTISGDPLRIDVDKGDGEVHVAHTNGVSIFRFCELPF